MTPMTFTEWTQFEQLYPRPPFDPEQQPEANLVPVVLDAYKRVGVLETTTTRIDRFRTSSVATSDTDLTRAGLTVGEDQTAAIQALLDVAGPKELIVDGRYSVSTLIVDSNTTITCLAGCGFKSLPGTNAAILRNRNWSKTTITDERIKICGGIWHGNAITPENTEGNTNYVTGSYVVVFQFFGVSGLKIDNVEVRNSGSFAGWFSNTDDTDITNSHVDQGPDYRVNADGWKFSGRNSRTLVADCLFRVCDDSVSFCPNESVLLTNAFVGPGDHIDAVARNLSFYGDFSYGVRLMSTTNRLDRVKISGLRGNIASHAVLIDPYREVSNALDPDGPGNFGSIEIEDVDVSYVLDSYKASIFHIDAPVEHLAFRNIRRAGDASFGPYNKPTFLFQSFADVGSLIIDGYRTDTGSLSPGAHLVCYGQIGTLAAEDVRISQTANPLPGDGSFAVVAGSGVIGSFRGEFSGDALYNTTADETAGKTGLPAAVSIFQQSRTLPFTGPNNLATPDLLDGRSVILQNTAASVARLAHKRAEQCPANILHRVRFQMSNHSGARQMGLAVRESGNGNSRTGYGTSIQPAAGQIYLFKTTGGADGGGGSLGVSLTEGAWYVHELSAVGSLISCFLQDEASGLWLGASGNWAPVRQACLTLTDASYASGVVGLYWYSDAAGTITLREWGPVEQATGIKVATGMTLSSPNGTLYNVTVSNAGAMVVTAV